MRWEFGTEDDRGVALVGYALVVLFVAVVGTVSLTAVGGKTSDSFESVGSTVAGDGSTVTSEVKAEEETQAEEEAKAEEETKTEPTPKEKWDKAIQDHKQAIKDAKAQKAANIAAAKKTYQSALNENKSLPKAQKKKANKAAKKEFNAAKKAANQTYKASVSTANKAKADAKAEYQATK